VAVYDAAVQLASTIRGVSYRFASVTEVLAKANAPKSGDDLAGISANDAVERVAARAVLANLTLRELREHPVVPYEADELTRAVEDELDDQAFRAIAHLTVGQFRLRGRPIQGRMTIETINLDEYGTGLRRAATAQHGDCTLDTNPTQIGGNPKIRAQVHQGTATPESADNSRMTRADRSPVTGNLRDCSNISIALRVPAPMMPSALTT
jgi:hypothetical protein